MKKKQSDNVENKIELRLITDHLFQTFNRIEENIKYIVFLRKNSKICDVSQKFYITQIDRFSRDTLLSFTHILDNDIRGSTLQAVIHRLDEGNIKKGFNIRLKKLRRDAKLITLHRSKMVAHHNTKFNKKFGDYYPMQLFNYCYPLNPCFCMKIKEKACKCMHNMVYLS